MKCIRCEKEKDLEEFYINKAKRVGRNRHCKTCDLESTKNYRINNPDSQKNTKMKRLYGVNIKDYNRMFEKQNGCCAICGKHQTEQKRRLHIDHDHKTGEIRELLCQSCNTGLGCFQDNIEIMNLAINYLMYHTENK